MFARKVSADVRGATGSVGRKEQLDQLISRTWWGDNYWFSLHLTPVPGYLSPFEQLENDSVGTNEANRGSDPISVYIR